MIIGSETAGQSGYENHLRQIIKECGLTVQAQCIKDSEKARDEAITELKKKMTIHVQTKQEEATWKEVMQQPVLDYFLQKTGEEGQQLVDLIKNLGG